METSTAHSLQVRTLEGRETIETSGCCHLKLVEPDGTKHWLCGRPKGKTDHRIRIEKYQPDGTYTSAQVYTDKEE